MELRNYFAICPCNPSRFTNQPHILSRHKICIPPSSLPKVELFQNVSSHTMLFPQVFKRGYNLRNTKISKPFPTPSQVVFCTDGELNPCLPFQTLKTFPREELLGKVVMVRFDSKLCPRDSQFNFEYPNENAVNTLKYLCNVGAKVVIVTHWVTSKISGEVFPTQTLADYLSIALGKKITAIEGVIGDKVENSIDKLQIGDILLLGNLSQYKEEVANCKDFARNLSARIDILVNDTFCDSHRVLASTVGVARFTYASIAGFHLADIMSLLTETIEKPKRPFIAISVVCYQHQI